MKVVLELQDQLSNVRKVTVRHDIVIGRGADCNLRLSAPQISRRHCFLRVGRDGVSVTDLDSSNGTFVDGQRLTGGIRQELTHGSVLALGPVRFLIRIREDAVSDVVLNAAVQKSGTKLSTAGMASDSSTVIGDADSLLTDSRKGSERPLNFSLEQAGATTDADEATENVEYGVAGLTNLGALKKAGGPKNMDSVPEIIDLGRRIAAMDPDEPGTADLVDPLPETEQSVYEASVVTNDQAIEDVELEIVDAVVEDYALAEDAVADNFIEDDNESSWFVDAADDDELVEDHELGGAVSDMEHSEAPEAAANEDDDKDDDDELANFLKGF